MLLLSEPLKLCTQPTKADILLNCSLVNITSAQTVLLAQKFLLPPLAASYVLTYLEVASQGPRMGQGAV